MFTAVAAFMVIAGAGDGGRTIAITLDDLPGVPSADLKGVREMNRGVLAALKRVGAPAIGFVNEEKLQVEGERDARVAVLRSWLEAGMTLGNHGYRHQGLTKTPLADYQDDVLRGEVVTRRLLAARELPLVYYRHPYTHTGPTADVKERFERFLTERNYRVAPFTIEHTDWVFAALYQDALDRGDRKAAASIRGEYLAFFERVCTFFEMLARDMFGRDIPQILLTHVNRLNGDALGDILALLQKRGYRFVTLDQALADEAYRTPDHYVGPHGPSWLHRWTVAKKLPLRQREEPDVSPEIRERHRALQEKRKPR